MRSQIIRLAESGAFDAAGFERAMELAGVRPDGGRWLAFVRAACLIGGALLMGAALIYFIAYNWHGMTRLVKIALLGLAMAVAAAGAVAKSPRSTPGRACLVFAILCLGALLGFVGQTYQTGADAWQLFAAWAVLALPWAIAAAWAPTWAILLAIADVAIMLRMGTRPLGIFEHNYIHAATALAVANAVAAAAAEMLHEHSVWRLLPRFAAVTALASASVAAIEYVMFDRASTYVPGHSLWDFAVFVLLMAVTWWQYRVRHVDRMILAAAALGVIGVATVTAAKTLQLGNASSWTLLGLLVVALSAGAAHWLRGIARETGEEEGELA